MIADGRICITNPWRSRKNLYTRLEVWIARAMWDAKWAGRGLEAELLWADLHYIMHLQKKRPPCVACKFWTLGRF